MEREYSRNQYSYRPRRNDSREDYQTGRKRQERVGFGERREKIEDRKRGVQRLGFADKKERSPYFSENWREREHTGVRRDRTGKEERLFSSKRPRIVKQEERTKWSEKKHNGVEYRKLSLKKERVEYRKPILEERRERLKEKHYSKKKILAHRLKTIDKNTELRLNRFISMGGVCSRRDADELIVAGRVKVNGEMIQVVGQKVRYSDKVEVDGVQIFPEKKVYLVLNKPKDYVTTVEDPLERKTVMTLIEDACKERIYPVGRLDRQTTGVLLFTNDGDLSKKLTHPKYAHKKIYHVFLDKPLAEKDLEMISLGVELEDGFIKADEIEYASLDHTEVGIEIHSGKNRIVRRIFEHFGYQIVKLDRVYFAGITKKNLPRGTWRFLTPKEVNILKAY